MTQPKGTKKKCHDAKNEKKRTLDALHFPISALPCVLDSLAPRGHATLRDATAQPPHGRYDSAQWVVGRITIAPTGVGLELDCVGRG